jgi:hypothetical protein
MNIEFTREDWLVIVAAIDRRLEEMQVELTHTEAREMQADLRKDLARLQAVRIRLGGEAPTGARPS